MGKETAKIEFGMRNEWERQDDWFEWGTSQELIVGDFCDLVKWHYSPYYFLTQFLTFPSTALSTFRRLVC